MTVDAIFLLVPLLLVWVATLVDIARADGRTWLNRAAWMVGCTIVWPLIPIWLLIRRPSNRFENKHRTDPAELLVSATLGHEAGEISDLEFREIKTRLRVGNLPQKK